MGSFRKVIAIGLDGLESRIVQRMFGKQQLPNLKKLEALGGFGRVRTTYPAQTPVAWSTFATGLNPGGHGIFDFVRRNPKNYMPEFALNRYEQQNAFTAPRAVNRRGGEPVWEVLSRAGVSSTVLRMPCAYPPQPFSGRLLAGMGVPDIRGGLGTPSFYTSDTTAQARESENVLHIDRGMAGRIQTHIIGPRNPRAKSDFTAAIELRPDAARRSVVIHSDGQPAQLEVREGCWSDWLHVKFKTGLLQSVRGMLRFYLVRMEPQLELYASPVNFDPNAPLFPISHPPALAQELTAKTGVFYTTGMIEDHGGLNNERFDEHAYLAQCADVMRERERMMRYELDRFDRGFFFCLFDTPDRLQHMFWRFQDPDNATNSDPLAAEYAPVIENHYRDCDAVVGRVLESTDDQTLLIVLSDHGMASFRRGVHLNTWLHEQGLLAFRGDVRPGEPGTDGFRNIDWDRTQAYSLGLAGIYINQQGREEQGCVSREDANAVRQKIASALTGFKDPETGCIAIRSVLDRDDVYHGPYAQDSPDLIVNFAGGYRVSWRTALGGVPDGLVEDNRKKWAGDHIIDPELVPGVLFMNRPFRRDNPSLIDMAPTITEALGVPRTAGMEGASLLI